MNEELDQLAGEGQPDGQPQPQDQDGLGAMVGIKKVTLGIVVTKADGTVIDYGTVASSDPDEAAQVGGTVTLEEPPYISIPKQLYRRITKRSTRRSKE